MKGRQLSHPSPIIRIPRFGSLSPSCLSPPSCLPSPTPNMRQHPLPLPLTPLDYYSFPFGVRGGEATPLWIIGGGGVSNTPYPSLWAGEGRRGKGGQLSPTLTLQVASYFGATWKGKVALPIIQRQLSPYPKI